LATVVAGQKYGIGIDESNHGALPEIYVATLSTNPTNFIKLQNRLTKKRKGVNIEKLLEEVEDFRFVVLEEKHISKIGWNAIKVPTIGLLVTAMSDRIYLPDTQIIVDGQPGSPHFHEDIRQIVSGHYTCRLKKEQLIFRADADRDYWVVNRADLIAYQLRRLYEKLANPSKGPYKDYRIPFEEVFPI